MNEPCYLGLDVGGSTIRTALACASGEPQRRRFEGGANPLRSDAATVVSALRMAFDVALDGIPSSAVVAVCVGLAGRSSPRAAELVRAAWEPRPAPRVRLLRSDVEIAHATAFGAHSGVLIAAGTGSIAMARGGGRARRFGGFGPQLGDDGGGHDLGLLGLRVAARSSEGRHPATALLAAAKHAWGDDPRDWAVALAGGASPAPFAQAVFRCAEAGDAASEGLLRGAGLELAHLAETAIAWQQAVEESPAVEVATAGSLLADPSLLLAEFWARLEAASIAFEPREFVRHPVDGALRLAREQAVEVADW